MTTHRYPILQSGFVNLTTEGLKEPTPVSPILRNDILLKEYRVPANKYFYSEKIDDLYRLWMANHAKLSDFEFREELLRTFKQLLGTSSFGKWVEFQSRKPSLGNMHAQFLESTLRYIWTGEPREVSIQQWVNLIDADMSSTIVDVDDSSWFCPKDARDYPRLEAGVDSILTAWTSIPGGWEDLIIFIYIVYGQRAMKNNAVSEV